MFWYYDDILWMETNHSLYALCTMSKVRFVSGSGLWIYVPHNSPPLSPLMVLVHYVINRFSRQIIHFQKVLKRWSVLVSSFSEQIIYCHFVYVCMCVCMFVYVHVLVSVCASEPVRACIYVCVLVCVS